MLSSSFQQCLDIPDVTVAPKSNNSIQQGGLSLYVMKDETKVEGPWGDPSYVPKENVVYNMRDLKCMDIALEWQQQVIKMLREYPDDRSINWVHQPEGNAGKSKLMKWVTCTSGLSMARIGLGSVTQIKTSVIEKRGQKYLQDSSYDQRDDGRS